jgi:hypothetical protein
MKRLALVLTLSALAVSAAACGGDDDDTDDAAPATRGTGGTLEVPDTLTEAQMACPVDAFMLEAITGVVFLEADPIIETGDGVACSFGHESGDLGIGVTTYASTAAQAMDTFTGIVDDAQPVGLDFADDAVWSPATTTLHVVKGGGGVQIQITDLAGQLGDALQVATELAELAI